MLKDQDALRRQLFEKPPTMSENQESVHVARNVLRITVVAAVLVLSSLGVMILSGCEFVYLPECDTECTAGGGNDSYGKAM